MNYRSLWGQRFNKLDYGNTLPYSDAPRSRTRELQRNDYQLIIRQRPERGRVAGTNLQNTPLDPPSIIQLIISEHLDPHQDYFRNPNFFMTCSLAESNEGEARSPRAAILGDLVSSLHRVKDMDDNDGAFFVFGGLSIKPVGAFKLEFTLFELRDLRWFCLQTIESEPVIVLPKKSFPGLSESTSLTRSFVDQGVRLRVVTKRKSLLGKHEPHESKGNHPSQNSGSESNQLQSAAAYPLSSSPNLAPQPGPGWSQSQPQPSINSSQYLAQGPDSALNLTQSQYSIGSSQYSASSSASGANSAQARSSMASSPCHVANSESNLNMGQSQASRSRSASSSESDLNSSQSQPSVPFTIYSSRYAATRSKSCFSPIQSQYPAPHPLDILRSAASRSLPDLISTQSQNSFGSSQHSASSSSSYLNFGPSQPSFSNSQYSASSYPPRLNSTKSQSSIGNSRRPSSSSGSGLSPTELQSSTAYPFYNLRYPASPSGPSSYPNPVQPYFGSSQYLSAYSVPRMNLSQSHSYVQYPPRPQVTASGFEAMPPPKMTSAKCFQCAGRQPQPWATTPGAFCSHCGTGVLGS